MWGKGGNNKPRGTTRVQTLIGQDTQVVGDILFSGGLHVEGTVKGNVVADNDDSSMLTLSEHGSIEGEVRVPNITLNGEVKGDVYAGHHVELKSNAKVMGNVYYNLIEMAIGAEVNGSLVHRSDTGNSSVVPLEVKEKQRTGE